MNGSRRIATVLLLATALNGGCQPLWVRVPQPSPPGEAPAPGQSVAQPVARSPEIAAFAPGNLRAEEFPAAIADLDAITRNPQAGEAEKAEAWRRLALLELATHNPDRNPARAAEALAAYLQLHPPEAARQEGEIWLALLHELRNREQQLAQQAEKTREKERGLAELNGEKQRLAQKLAAQESLSAKLKADIEKLKLIDLAVEKKRKGLR